MEATNRLFSGINTGPEIEIHVQDRGEKEKRLPIISRRASVDLVLEDHLKSEISNFRNNTEQGDNIKAKKKLPNLLQRSLVVRLKKAQTTDVRYNERIPFPVRSEQGVPNAWDVLPMVRKKDAVDSWRLNTAEATFDASDGEAVNIDRKAVSAPAVADEKDQNKTNNKVENKLTPVQEALKNAEKLRQSIREDKLAGISTSRDYISQLRPTFVPKRSKKSYKSKVSRDHNHVPPQASRKPKRGVKKEENDNSTYNGFKPPPISAKFTFPKSKDFIVMNDGIIRNLDIGWKIQSKFEKDIVENTTNKKGEIRTTRRGQLCQKSFPVTKAMNRQGTSTSKRTGKALNKPGDCNVVKVWTRSELTNVSPYQMAAEDTCFDLNSKYECTLPADSKISDPDSQCRCISKWTKCGALKVTVK